MTKENIERFNDLKMQIMNRSFSRIIFIMFLIVIFTLLISANVHATNITQAHNKTIGTTQGGNYPAGMRFKLNVDTTNIQGIVINKVASSTGNKCWLYTGNATDGSNMNWTAFASFVGTQCVINSPLTANFTYVVAVGSDYGVSITETYGTAGGFPVTDSKLSWSGCALPNLAQNRFDFFAVYECDVPSVVLLQSDAVVDIPASLRFDSVINVSTNQSINITWITTGNYSYSEIYRDGTLKYNGSLKNYFDDGLNFNTNYTYNISIFWNSTIRNESIRTIKTKQQTQQYKYNESWIFENFDNCDEWSKSTNTPTMYPDCNGGYLHCGGNDCTSSGMFAQLNNSWINTNFTIINVSFLWKSSTGFPGFGFAYFKTPIPTDTPQPYITFNPDSAVSNPNIWIYQIDGGVASANCKYPGNSKPTSGTQNISIIFKRQGGTGINISVTINNETCLSNSTLTMANGTGLYPVFFEGRSTSDGIDNLSIYWNSFVEEIINTPLNITFNSQYPPSINVTSLIENNLNISYNYTKGNSEINISSIYLNYTILNGKIYENGTLSTLTGIKVRPSYNISKSFYYQFDANDILSGTYPLPHNLYESQVHSSIGLSATGVIKAYITNVSMTAPTRFYEVMCNNTDSTANVPINIYIANSSYTAGNIGTNSNVQLLYTIPDGNAYNHCHKDTITNNTYQCHHVIPSNLNLTIGRTDTMQIIVAGRNTNLVKCYTIPNPSQTYTSTNTGGAWTLQSYALDTHFHQIESNEIFQYQALGSDSYFDVQTANIYQAIGGLLLPPTNVFISSPTAITYDNSVLINHSVCQSQIAINQYKYEYTDGVTYTEIVNNNYPNTSYIFNSANVPNGYYYVRFTCYDANGLSSFADSPFFTIAHPSVPTNTSVSIVFNTTEIKDGLVIVGENIQLLWIVVLMIIFLIFGVAIKQFALWGISGFFSLALAVYYMSKVSQVNNPINNMFMIVFFILGFALIILGITLHIMYIQNEEKKKDIYSRY